MSTLVKYIGMTAVVAVVLAAGSTARADFYTNVTATASSEQRSASLLVDYSGSTESGFNPTTMTYFENGSGATMWNTATVTKEDTWVMFDLGETKDIEDMIVFNYNLNYATGWKRGFVTADVWSASAAPTVTNPTVATPGNWTRVLDDQAFDAADLSTSYDTPTEVTLDLSGTRYVLMNDIVNSGATEWGNSYGLSEVLFTIPEPASGLLLIAGAAGLGLLRRKMRG